MARVNQEYREGARERIITAAINVAIEKGWKAMTLEAIAQKVGVSIPALYSYFRNRDALENEVVNRVIQIHDDEFVATLSRDGDIHRIIQNYADLIFIHQARHVNIYSLLPIRFLNDPMMHGKVADSMTAELDLISNCLTRAKSRGELKKYLDVNESAQLISSLTAGIMLKLIFDSQINERIERKRWITGVERILLISQDPDRADVQ
ncbi:TetR/AcrR family transcriptional regulator [uncultured Methanoregula sp.]|uniref:TetR/AcrR family transcriptional regulator n=1 Tax=uncultured Methanoregula sp. TaxID=1005933 RepID=UPI002AAAB427|nr:TetR/AcrR family transcriptional regulator [uncultured Methanoregula sp.]